MFPVKPSLTLYSLAVWNCTYHSSSALLLRQKAFPGKEMPFPMCLYSVFHKVHSGWDLSVLWKKYQLKNIALTGKTHSIGFPAAVIH